MQIALKCRCERVCITQNAPRGPIQFLQRRHALAEIIERGAGVLGASEEDVLVAQGNLVHSYSMLDRNEEALRAARDVRSGYVKLLGEEALETLGATNNLAATLLGLQRYAEAKALLLKTVRVARRALGEGHRLTLKMRSLHAQALYTDDGATLDDTRKAVTTLEDAERISRRVFGGSHPMTTAIEGDLQCARLVLNARQE